MNTNISGNLANIARLSQKQDGTLSGGYISVTGGRYRVVIDGETTSSASEVNHNCPCNDDHCYPDINTEHCTNGSTCYSAAVTNKAACHNSVCSPDTNGSSCSNTQCGPPTDFAILTNPAHSCINLGACTPGTNGSACSNTVQCGPSVQGSVRTNHSRDCGFGNNDRTCMNTVQCGPSFSS